MKALLIWMIRFYQREISPARPPCCRFIPTCSAYALEAVEKYGPWKGGWLALRRILRCNPFHRQKSIEYDSNLRRLWFYWAAMIYICSGYRNFCVF